MTVFSVKFLCHPNCDSDGHPVKCCKQTPAVSVINNFRLSQWVMFSRFDAFDAEEYRDIQVYVRGFPVSLEIAPFNRSHLLTSLPT